MYEEEDCTEPLPKKIKTGFSHFGGSYIASCTKCEFKSAYWECACDLIHDCKTWR